MKSSQKAALKARYAIQILLMKAFQPDISQVESSLGEPVGFSTFSVNMWLRKVVFFLPFFPRNALPVF